MEPRDARLELARRYLHLFGPSTVESFARWASIGNTEAGDAFGGLAGTLAPVTIPIGDAWILADDEAEFRQPSSLKAAAPVRFLPSGDAYYLLWDADREILVKLRTKGER
jgi:Winged helix DNA-binding domain